VLRRIQLPGQHPDGEYASPLQRLVLRRRRARGRRRLWKIGDVAIIDGFMVKRHGAGVGWIASLVRLFQTGYIYHYAFNLIIGAFGLLSWWFLRT